MTRYCVIGAGAAGLSALQQLRQAGYEVDCYEQTDRVGGHWHTDYDALHLITARDQTHFEDFPMPADYPHFPRRDQVRAYLESYAQHHGLYDIIQFETAVTSVVPVETSGPVGAAGWTVTLHNGRRLDYDGVLVANGHLWDPDIPSPPGTFTGHQIHSGAYQNTGDVEGSRVLVVGAGNSGCDLAVDAAQHRLDVDIVIRQGVYFQPKTYFGMPRQQLPWLADFSPEEQDFIARMLAKVKLGDWRDYPGMPEPQGRTLAEGRAVVNDLLLFWVHHGRIAIRPGIERLDGRTVHFSDGTSAEYDTILWATGFHPSLPFLDESLIQRRRGVPLRYAGGIVPEGLEKLYFIGLSAPRGPQIPIFGVQTKLAIRMIALHEAAPDGFAGVGGYLGGLQEADDRIDVARVSWLEQLADTERLLDAYELIRPVPAQGSAQGSVHA